MAMATLIGQPISRIDGPLKVSGRATYAAEYWNVGQPLYGFIVGATIGRGHVAAIDTNEAEQAPGVRMVMTHRNAPAQGTPDLSSLWVYSRAYPTLVGSEVHHFGEPVALVVADTWEQARAAARLVRVTYVEEPGRFDFAAHLDQAYAPKTANAGLPTDSAVGDFEPAFARAEVRIDQHYTTPYQSAQPMEPHARLAAAAGDHPPRYASAGLPTGSAVGDFDLACARAEVRIDQHYTTPYQSAQPMEPHACLAVPDGDNLTIYASAQIVAMARTSIANTLQISEERIRLVASFVGGGFGSKLGIHNETILAALAARELKRPVKVVLTRQQIFHLLGV